MKKSLFKFSVRDITEMAVMVALAVVLDKFVKIQIGANGGSINIATVPLFIIAFRHGWFKAFIASGIVFGLITNLLDGYGFNTYPFEYLLAFGSVAVSGLFGKFIYDNYSKKNIGNKGIAIALIILCVAIHFVARLLFATIDSMLFYEVDFAGGIAYNISYIGPTCLAVLVTLIVLSPAIMSINKIYPTTLIKEEDKEEIDNEQENDSEQEND